MSDYNPRRIQIGRIVLFRISSPQTNLSIGGEQARALLANDYVVAVVVIFSTRRAIQRAKLYFFAYCVFAIPSSSLISSGAEVEVDDE